MNSKSMKDTIRDLLSEDDYGYWELAWALQIQSPDDEKVISLYEVIEDLVNTGEIVSKRRDHSSSKLEEVSFNPNELLSELHRVNHPDPEKDYWFGSRTDTN